MTQKNEIWSLAEQHDGKLSDVSFELIAWCKKMLPKNSENYSLCSLVLADGMNETEIEKLIFSGADKVYYVQHKKLKKFLVEPYARVLTSLINEHHPDVFLASATTTGKTIFPYISVLVHGGLTADCTGLEIDEETGLLLQTRPAIGGNILATIKTPSHRPQMATVRPKSISKPVLDFSKSGTVEKIHPELDHLQLRTKRISFTPFSHEGPNIESANIVVAGGKGLKSKNNFDLVVELAEALGGAVGTSRPPVDQGWQPYEVQVGLSGKTISPDLYIACGISGSIQHLAGIQTAGKIVAINNDPHAQIFQVADFGVVTDLFEFLPILSEKLRDEISTNSN